MDKELAARLAKALAVACVRNTFLEALRRPPAAAPGTHGVIGLPDSLFLAVGEAGRGGCVPADATGTRSGRSRTGNQGTAP